MICSSLCPFLARLFLLVWSFEELNHLRYSSLDWSNFRGSSQLFRAVISKSRPKTFDAFRDAPT
jgi:hypothetical protein